MRGILRHKRAADPAAKRYPEALTELLSWGMPTDDFRYTESAERLREYVPDLIRMVLDEDLNQREEDDPAVWAPLHALKILGVLGAEAAAQPLTACLDSMDDWITETLSQVYARIGPAAIPVLQAYLEDVTRDWLGRAKASESLVAIAKAHPSVMGDMVAYLMSFLDRPSADDSAEEENLTSLVIGDLAELGDPSVYPAIKRAYDENRVNPQVISLEDVEVMLGLRPEPGDIKALVPSEEPGLRLVLRCKVCGRERSYLFPKVYCDVGTIRDEEKLGKYSPIIIPQRVVCQKCGAVDQYEISPLSRLALLVNLLVRSELESQGLRGKDQFVEYVEFTTRWGHMHPQEAMKRYQEEIDRHPRDANLHVGYGNVLRFLGRVDEAGVEYQRAGVLDPEKTPRSGSTWLSWPQSREIMSGPPGCGGGCWR